MFIEEETYIVVFVVVVVVVVIIIIIVLVLIRLGAGDAIVRYNRSSAVWKRCSIVQLLISARFCGNGAPLIKKYSKVDFFPI